MARINTLLSLCRSCFHPKRRIVIDGAVLWRQNIHLSYMERYGANLIELSSGASTVLYYDTAGLMLTMTQCFPFCLIARNILSIASSHQRPNSTF